MRWAAIAVVVALVLWWGWPGQDPIYMVGGGQEVYPCRQGAEPLPVTFSRDGLIAEARFRGHLYKLRFVRNGFLEDVYAAGEWKLTIEPEANWYGPDGLHLTCGW